MDELLKNQELINRARPFTEPLLSQVKKFYRISLTWSSNALEGNTLTESETKVLLEDGLTVGGKPLRDTYEAIGHSKAYSYMYTLLHNQILTEKDILTLHSLFYKEIDEKNAGQYRKIPVFISGSNYPVCLPEEIPAAMKDFCHWIEANQAIDPITLSALAHQKFVFIHPFVDGNGRVARLIMNTLLIQRGYLPVIIPPVRRVEYIHALEKAHTDTRPFIQLIKEMEIESQRDFIRFLGLDKHK